jgi:hypothetical protein
MASSERLCVVCGGRISSMKRKGAIYCSSACSYQDHYEKRKEKLKGAKVTLFALVHSCIRPELQMGEAPDPLTCRCREEMAVEKINECVSRGEIALVGPEQHACYSSKRQKVPRVATIEKANIERANLAQDSRRLLARWKSNFE